MACLTSQRSANNDSKIWSQLSSSVSTHLLGSFGMLSSQNRQICSHSNGFHWLYSSLIDQSFEHNSIITFSGDSRANMHPWLTGLHNLFARYHNYIAYQFYRINPEWDDEHLYQEARRVIGATLQYITYYEFLPALLGKDALLTSSSISNFGDKRRIPGETLEDRLLP